jgi:multidrug efflux system membrane fusion protein
MSDQPATPPDVRPLPPDHQLPAGPPPKKPPRKHRILVWIAVLVIFGLVFWWVLTRQAATPPAAGGRRAAAGGTVTALTAASTQGDIGVYEEAIGTVTPVFTASITSQATGQIVAVHYREGQIVTKGSPLVDIDPRPYEATLTQAEGTLEHDTQLLEQAKMDAQRYREAWARNSIAKQILDDQEKVVLQDQGTVKNDEGTVAYDKVQLGYCHIVSPITGRVGLRLVDPGNVVTADSGTVLAVVTQIQPITVIFTISEDNLPPVTAQMRQGHPLEVQALDRAQLTIISKGRLLTTDNQIDTATGTLKLRAQFANQDRALFPNQFVNTRLLVKTIHNAVLVPSSTVQHNGTQAFVWAIIDGKAEMKNVVTGVTDNNMTQVTGIGPGTVVANGSFEKLTPGATVIPPSAPTGTGKGGRQRGGNPKGDNSKGNDSQRKGVTRGAIATQPGSSAP